ncbi:MAG: response regulator [Kofleriaceae bacterium]
MRTLIVADDNAHMRWLVRTTLRDQFDDIVEVSDGRELFRQLVHCSMTRNAGDVLVVTDIRMPAYSGLDVLATYDELGYHPKTIVMTAFPDPDAYAQVARAGSTLIPKPFATAELYAVVERACAR